MEEICYSDIVFDQWLNIVINSVQHTLQIKRQHVFNYSQPDVVCLSVQKIIILFLADKSVLPTEYIRMQENEK